MLGKKTSFFFGVAVALMMCLTFVLPVSATTLTITNQNFFVDGNGGGFTGYLNGNSGQIFQLFCADYRNVVSPPDTYPVNIDNLATGIGDTRYGTTSQSGFSFQNAPDGMTFGNAVDRYLKAGWLITQYDMSAGAQNGTRDVGIQDAIWNLLDVNAVNHVNGDVVTWENNAVTWESTLTSGQKSAFMGEVNVYTSLDVGLDNDLTNDPLSRYSIGKQEFITFSGTPEPAQLGLTGVGLVFIGLFGRYWRRSTVRHFSRE